MSQTLEAVLIFTLLADYNKITGSNCQDAKPFLPLPFTSFELNHYYSFVFLNTTNAWIWFVFLIFSYFDCNFLSEIFLNPFSLHFRVPGCLHNYSELVDTKLRSLLAGNNICEYTLYYSQLLVRKIQQNRGQVSSF